MKKAKDIDEYLAGVPEPARTTLNKVRATIRSVVPKEAIEAISYGMPAFIGDSSCASPRFRNIAVSFP